jgi:hypothetical protein
MLRKRCPLCGSHLGHRIGRSYWMRLLPMSRHYRCAYCRSRVVTVLGCMAWRVSLPQFE